MTKLLNIAVAAVTLCMSSTVFAQTPPASTVEQQAPLPGPVLASPATVAGSSPNCELHIWPAARVTALTQGAGASFGLIGAIVDSAGHANQNKRDKAFITSALDAPSQARALKQVDLPKLLDLPPVTVITHDQGVELKGDEIKRLADSPAQCYYDVVVREVFYFKASTLRGKMRTFIAVERFDGAKNTLDYKDSANHALDVKLPKEGEDAGPATDALLDAYKADVTEFSEKFVRKTSKKK